VLVLSSKRGFSTERFHDLVKRGDNAVQWLTRLLKGRCNRPEHSGSQAGPQERRGRKGITIETIENPLARSRGYISARWSCVAYLGGEVV
jgi:hypothetical protein